MDLIIDAEFQTLLGPLSNEELQLLEESLLAEGCREPLRAAQMLGSTDKILLDGHNRYALCEKHGIKYSVNILTHIMTREEAIEWIEANNLGRRNIQGSEIRARYYERTKEKRGGDRKSIKAKEERKDSEEKSTGNVLPVDFDGDSKEVKAVAAKLNVTPRQLRYDEKWVRDKDKVRVLFPDLDQRLQHNKTSKRAVQAAAKAIDNNEEERARNIILNLIPTVPRRGSKVLAKENAAIHKDLVKAEANPEPEPYQFRREDFPTQYSGPEANKLNKEAEEARRVDREIAAWERKSAILQDERSRIQSLDGIKKPNLIATNGRDYTPEQLKRMLDKQALGSVENWEKFQFHYGEILKHWAILETLRPDIDHVMEAREMIKQIVFKVEQISKGILET